MRKLGLNDSPALKSFGMHDRAIWNNFERLYIDYQPRLIAYALRFVGDSVEAR